jgi:hypothetical protein
MRTHTFSLLAALSLLFCARLTHAATPEWWQATRDIKIGDSRQKVDASLRQFETVTWSSLTNHFRLDFLRAERVSAWLAGPIRQVGEGYILGVFAADGKLTDLLRFEPQARVFPLVRGTYAQRLASIKKGMSVDELYRLVGEAMPYRYRRDAGGKWVIEFSYQGAGPDFWLYDADAATGKILSVHVSSI